MYTTAATLSPQRIEDSMFNNTVRPLITREAQRKHEASEEEQRARAEALVSETRAALEQEHAEQLSCSGRPPEFVDLFSVGLSHGFAVDAEANVGLEHALELALVRLESRLAVLDGWHDLFTRMKQRP
eukprot:SAG31_NODE_2639_length_5327_cov_15.148240_6_plen_128_part_00